MHTQSYVHIYIHIWYPPVPTFSVLLLVFTWFGDLFTWLEFGTSFERGYRYHIYFYMYMFFFSNGVARMVFSLIELNFKDSILGRMHSECIPG